jgi:hypothetical protein
MPAGLNTFHIPTRLLIYGGAALVSFIGWAVREWRARQAQSWPAAQGTVESALTRDVGEGRERRTVFELSYSYSINGEYYGSYHQLLRERDLKAFPKGSYVLVHYKASDPSDSFLDREDLRSRIQTHATRAIGSF